MSIIVQQHHAIDALSKVIAEAVNPARLKQLRQALTPSMRPRSHYSGLSEDEAREVSRAAGERLRALRKPCAKAAAAAAKPPPQMPPQIDLFGGADRWPRRPWCADDLSSGIRVRSLAQALTKPYIQANPPHLRIWSIYDIDRPGAALAWDDANLPPPAWAAVNRVNAHAHLVWGLRAPVLVDSLEARDAPMRYLYAIESMMRERMQADGNFGGLITKNPLHPLWRVLHGPQLAYDLSDLAEYLPGIEKHRPKQGVSPERIGVGRNIALFDALRKWAYVQIRDYKNAAGLAAWNDWVSRVQLRALVLNAEMFGSRILDEREAWHIAKSVSKGVWRKGRAAVLASDTRFSGLQKARRAKAENAQKLKETESWLQNIRSKGQ